MSNYVALATLSWLATNTNQNSYYLLFLLAALNKTICGDLRSSTRLLFNFTAVASGITISWISQSAAFDQAILLISLVALISTFFPFFAILLSNLVIRRTKSTFLKISIPSLFFVLAGELQSRIGIGRAVWWNNSGAAGLNWLGVFVGPGGVDFLIGLVSFSLGAAFEEVLSRRVGSEDGEEESEGMRAGGREGEEENRSKLPWIIIGLYILLSSISPNAPPAVEHLHPSPTSPNYVYPLLRIACISPPQLESRNSKKAKKSSVENWIAESAIVAATGVKLLSWSEGAVILEADPAEDEMGKNELDLLKKVQVVAQQYGVLIQAAYILPVKGSHDQYNVATLISPSSDGSLSIIYSTSKQLPIPFIESYSTRFRSDFGATRGAVPLGIVELKHSKGTPSPNLTPLQRLGIASIICFDASLPSIFRHFIPTIKDSLARPSLILNPSSSPSTSISLSQLDQIKARAIETSSFILRCDNSFGGISAVISPDGIELVKKFEGGSFEFEIDLENASERRVWWMVLNEWYLMIGLLFGISLGYGVELLGNRGENLILIRDGYDWVRERITRVRQSISSSRAGNREDSLISFE